MDERYFAERAPQAVGKVTLVDERIPFDEAILVDERDSAVQLAATRNGDAWIGKRRGRTQMRRLGRR